jgi:hypothetical protein
MSPKHERPTPEDRRSLAEKVMAFIDLGASGRSDTSERVDDALDEALRDSRPR